MKKSSLALIFITLCYIFLILTSHNPLIARNVFAESPSFSNQEINTGIHNGIRVDAIKHTETTADYKDSFDSSSDIQRVTYFSDGKTLNATIWLGGAVKQNPSLYGASTAVYGVLIDADNNPPSIDQRIKDFWNVYGSLISLVGAGFAGAASTFVFEYVKNHKGKNK